eukprot:1159295-Pelagomonas_calceolata.AAC.3
MRTRAWQGFALLTFTFKQYLGSMRLPCTSQLYLPHMFLVLTAVKHQNLQKHRSMDKYLGCKLCCFDRVLRPRPSR